jgi:dynein intermediate chain 1
MPPKTRPVKTRETIEHKSSAGVSSSAINVEKQRQTDQEDDIYKQPIKRIIRPENQLNLTEEQLNEELPLVLTATDPNIANNIVKFNYKEKTFKRDPEGPMDHLAFHFQMNGSALYKEGEDAIQQMNYEEEMRMNAENAKREAAQEIADDDVDINAVPAGKSQFNFSERATQTPNEGTRSIGVETEPPR